jgi:hypothetical protein
LFSQENGENAKNVKKLQQQLKVKDAVISAKFLCGVLSNLFLFCCFFSKELQVMVEDEQKARDEARESQAKAERNANKLNAEMEELRAQLEQVSS